MATYVDLSTLHTPTPRGKPPATWAAQIRENFEWLQANRRVICTSASRPTGFEGLEIYETDTDLVYVHDGANYILVGRLGAWTTFSPTVTQSGTVSRTATYARWARLWGRVVIAQWSLALTGAGTGANNVTVSLPVVGVATSLPIGQFYLNDASAGGVGNFLGTAVMSTTSVVAAGIQQTASGFLGSVGFTAALASGDFLGGAVVYEAAS